MPVHAWEGIGFIADIEGRGHHLIQYQCFIPLEQPFRLNLTLVYNIIPAGDMRNERRLNIQTLGSKGIVNTAQLQQRHIHGAERLTWIRRGLTDVEIKQCVVQCIYTEKELRFDRIDIVTQGNGIDHGNFSVRIDIAVIGRRILLIIGYAEGRLL